MEKLKRVFRSKKAICLALALLLIGAVLAGGVTYARYQWEFQQASYFFTPENTAAAVVYDGHITDDMVHRGILPGTVETWSLTSSGGAFQFSVANGDGNTAAQQDRHFVICIAAGLTVEDPENLAVVLTYTDEGGNAVSVTGEAAAIEEGTFQYDAFGDGWIYRFYTDQNELRFDLTGGSFDYRNFTVTVIGKVSPTLLELQVTQVPAD